LAFEHKLVVRNEKYNWLESGGGGEGELKPQAFIRRS
jgi:hypothetical protein